ncbi:hypothetical protein ONE63_011295 [Megalurothrips usitatus]|uniref:Uncharacterized protein n=1 Tax=Megalurothrips usitatus TaxID=439358 RepID=A0AAV7X3N4_9NEOP|nr:hypothetical protein ONE63_011295 [Megalurothrips usitatus]
MEYFISFIICFFFTAPQQLEYELARAKTDLEVAEQESCETMETIKNLEKENALLKGKCRKQGEEIDLLSHRLKVSKENQATIETAIETEVKVAEARKGRIASQEEKRKALETKCEDLIAQLAAAEEGLKAASELNEISKSAIDERGTVRTVRMWFHAALVLAALAAACHCTQGNSPVIGLSGDNTRHGVVVQHGDFKVNQKNDLTNLKEKLNKTVDGAELVVTKYHVDTLIQTRFARSVIEVEVQNNADAPRQIIVPFAVPAAAMLTSFEIESDGEKHQARAVLKDSIQVDSTSTSATIK